MMLPSSTYSSNEHNEIYLAGGCLWGVQEFIRYVPGVLWTEAGRVNGTSRTTQGEYDGYAECVRVLFSLKKISVFDLLNCFFEIIDPYSLNQQGKDIGKKYRTGIYSENEWHLQEARRYIQTYLDVEKVCIEVLPLSNYIRSEDEHQDRLYRFPDDSCHIPKKLLHKYKN